MVGANRKQGWTAARLARAVLLAGLAASCGSVKASADDVDPWPPAVPVGLDAYARWDLWPLQRIGMRAYMRSTYDRDGLNRTADASHFLYAERPDFNVVLDVAGRGILYFVRTNRWHGSPWHYEVDGTDHVVSETATASPDAPPPDSRFEPDGAFPPPLALTWPETKGADLNWVPVPFERSFRLAFGRTFYGTGYTIHHQFAEDAPLSSPPRPFDPGRSPDPEALRLIGNAGGDIAPAGIARKEAAAILEPGGTVRLFRLEGPASVRALTIAIPRAEALSLSDARIRITWDDRAFPSVDAPLGLFFGAGLLHNRTGERHLVKAFPVGIRYEGGLVHLACYFPMPFFRSATVELTAPAPLRHPARISAAIRHEPLRRRPASVGYFHATYRDLGGGEPGRDHVLLDTRGIEGAGDWSGSFVGTSFIFTDKAELRTLEGDPRFFFDDARSPQAYGTGTEEWGGGGDYWGGQRTSLPFAGHPIGVPTPAEATVPEDLVHSTYRFLLADLFPFGRNARIQFEHGGTNDMSEPYRSVAYWYGLPAASLVRTDGLEVGNAASEHAHGYSSPDATPPQVLTSRYEVGPDTYQSPRPPLADPNDHAEWEFEAPAGNWVARLHGRASAPQAAGTAGWVQLDGDIGTDRGALPYALPPGVEGEPRYGWSGEATGLPPLRVTFDRPGRHRLRIQPGEAGHRIDQVWLAPATSSAAPADANARPMPLGEGLSGSGIVLDARDARVSGGVRIVEDARASADMALELAPAPARPVTVVPAEAKTVRYTRGASEFRLAIRPDNHGVMLRRTLDYAMPDQRAAVFVADGDQEPSEWEPAGIWHLAGSNTFYHSFPARELDAPAPAALTSNRRFREDEFLLPARMTKGRRSIRLRLAFEPVGRPLLPGMAVPASSWSEIDYAAYSWVEPDFDLPDNK